METNSMRTSLTLLSLISFGSYILSHALPPIHNNYLGVGTTFGSLNVPVRPAQTLNNIRLTINDHHIPDHQAGQVDSGQLYYHIHLYLVSLWKTPNTVPLAWVGQFDTPPLRTRIVPDAKFNLLTLPVAASVLLKLLDRVATYDLIKPPLPIAELKTRTTPPQPIGKILSEYAPELGSSSNPPTGTQGRNKTTAIPGSDVPSMEIYWDGQNPRFPEITPQVWLQSITDISAQIFAQHYLSEILDKYTSFRFQRAQTASTTLQMRVEVTDVPAGKEPLDMDELVTMLTATLYEVTKRRKFEMFHALVEKDGRIAAKFELSYVSRNGIAANA